MLSGLLLSATACSHHRETVQMADPSPPPSHQSASVMDSIVLEPGAVYNGCHVTKSVQVNAGWDVNPAYCDANTAGASQKSGYVPTSKVMTKTDVGNAP
jgi:hypothetical protein